MCVCVNRQARGMSGGGGGPKVDRTVRDGQGRVVVTHTNPNWWWVCGWMVKVQEGRGGHYSVTLGYG